MSKLPTYPNGPSQKIRRLPDYIAQSLKIKLKQTFCNHNSMGEK
ncbi:MAG: hypothetical protein NTU49_02915 [Gammaproteobacteria bacterium]|nr:hypothetical protein [Gammaproteobacteria bacterium]